jgi:hypothetical protein
LRDVGLMMSGCPLLQKCFLVRSGRQVVEHRQLDQEPPSS